MASTASCGQFAFGARLQDVELKPETGRGRPQIAAPSEANVVTLVNSGSTFPWNVIYGNGLDSSCHDPALKRRIHGRGARSSGGDNRLAIFNHHTVARN